jgi:hypothetical protein
MRSARSANGPKVMAVSSQDLVDLPRPRAMSYATGIEAIETRAMISHADMDDPEFVARRLAASAKSEAASVGGLRPLTNLPMLSTEDEFTERPGFKSRTKQNQNPSFFGASEKGGVCKSV